MKTLITVLVLGLSTAVFASEKSLENMEKIFSKIAILNEAMDQSLQLQDQECVETRMLLDSKTQGRGGDLSCVKAVRAQAKLNSQIISILYDLGTN